MKKRHFCEEQFDNGISIEDKELELVCIADHSPCYIQINFCPFCGEEL